MYLQNYSICVMCMLAWLLGYMYVYSVYNAYSVNGVYKFCFLNFSDVFFDFCSHDFRSQNNDFGH